MRILTACAVVATATLLATGLGCRDESPATSTTTAGAGGSGGAGGDGGQGNTGAVGELRVMNWNTRNFFNDVADSPGTQETVKTPAQYEAQVTAVAAMIASFDPDVVVFAEVENQSVLDAVDEALGGVYPERRVTESNDPRGIDIAAMSRVAFSEVVTHTDDEFSVVGTGGPFYRYARDCVEYHFTWGGRPIVLLGVHFISKGPPDQPERRLAEAQYTRAIANSLMESDPERGVIVLGDFNDVPQSQPWVYMIGNPPDEFTDAALLAPDPWTFLYNGNQELIDHQISNPVMAERLREDSVVIPHGNQVTAGSDHSPIFAIYDL